MIPFGISNSSPIIALERIGRLELLMQSFERVVVPKAVAQEVANLPSWIEVHERATSARMLFPTQIHVGEAEVIALALEQPTGVAVLDDFYAREFAKRHSIPVIGTLGLLLRAKRAGLLPAVLPLLEDLTVAGFRISAALSAEVQRLAGE